MLPIREEGADVVCPPRLAAREAMTLTYGTSDFSDIVAILNKVMGFGDFVESKALGDPRPDGLLTP